MVDEELEEESYAICITLTKEGMLKKKIPWEEIKDYKIKKIAEEELKKNIMQK